MKEKFMVFWVENHCLGCEVATLFHCTQFSLPPISIQLICRWGVTTWLDMGGQQLLSGHIIANKVAFSQKQLHHHHSHALVFGSPTLCSSSLELPFESFFSLLAHQVSIYVHKNLHAFNLLKYVLVEVHKMHSECLVECSLDHCGFGGSN